MGERKTEEGNTRIVKVEELASGNVYILADNGRGSVLVDTGLIKGNIVAVETPISVRKFEELARKNGTTVEIERQKFYDSI